MSEGWWRRGESNPRPETFHLGVYILSPIFQFRLTSHRSDRAASLLIDVLFGHAGKDREDVSLIYAAKAYA